MCKPVFIFIVCANLYSVSCSSCIQLEANIGNPNAKWYTTVTIKGLNNCSDVQNLSGQTLTYKSDYPATGIWGSKDFIPITSDYNNGQVQMTFGNKAILAPAASFQIIYGANLNGNDPMTVTNLAIESTKPTNGVTTTKMPPTTPMTTIRTTANSTTNNAIPGPALSIFWCGFSGIYCGQSKTDDVYPRATHVIMAFGNTNPDGSISTDVFPTALIEKWQADGKKVLLSIGGQNGHWAPILDNPANFVNSIANIINTNKIDGVDLDIEAFEKPPCTVVELLKQMRARLGNDVLIVTSPMNVNVIPSPWYGVPDCETGSGYANWFVPIINRAIDLIDLVQIQCYNNWYVNHNVPDAQFLVENYLGWRNQWTTKIDGYIGVPPSKLVIGVPASTSAANPAFYTPPEEVKKAIEIMNTEYSGVRGIMHWDSHWDKLNNYVISKAAADALGL